MQDETTIRTTRGQWEFVWHGGRLMDIYWEGSCVDAFSVGRYDIQAGKQLAPFTARTLDRAVDEWMREYSDDYLRNAVPYL